MKALIISLFILLLIIALWFWILNYMDQSIHHLIEIIDDNLKPAVINSNWEKAENQFLILKQKWNRYQRLYNLFIDQAAVSEINYSNARIGVYLDQKATVLALSELSYVKEHLSALHEDELIRIENIL